jgi:Domain of unknown function (DUF4270)
MTKFWGKMRRRISLRSLSALALISLLFVSCIDVNKSTGGEFVPDDQKFVIAIKEFDLPVQQKSSDSIQTIFSGDAVIGAYKDPELGITTSAAAVRFIPQVRKNTFGNNPVPKSLKLSIAVSSKIVLDQKDANIPQNVYVYVLRKDLDSTVMYNNSITAADFDPVPLAGNVFFGGDSINMDLPLSYAADLLSATQEERDSVPFFQKRFKGFYIATEPLPGSLTGGRFNIITTSNIYMTLTYNHIDDTISKSDSVLIYYASESEPNINIIKHSSKSLETSTPTNKLYVEGLAGLKPFIDFSAVKNTINSWVLSQNSVLSKVVIAKAEIILPYEFPADYLTIGQYPSQLFLATRETEDLYEGPYYRLLPEISLVDDKGLNNRSKFYYSMNITSYLQSVLKGKLTKKNELEAYVVPAMSLTNSSTGETSYFFDNTAYSKGVFNGTAATRKPKLRISYAIIP